MSTTAKYIIKIVTLGNTQVGKTSIIRRYLEDKFEDNTLATIGIDFKSKYINFGKVVIKVLLWDTAGQERFQDITKQYYKNANCALLVFDITDKKSFQRVEFWYNQLKDNSKTQDLYIVLVGNKKDNETQRKVTSEEIKEYSKKNNIKYFEVSAKDNISINDLFEDAITNTAKKVIVKSQENEPECEDRISLSMFGRETNNKDKTSRCC